MVVATRNRRAELERSLGRHECPVVLVDNASTDGTADVVRSGFPGVEIIRLPRNRGAAARNVGVAAASTPYVAFADDDSWWALGALDRAAEVFDAHPRLAILAGRVLVGPTGRLDPVSAVMADSPLGTDPDLPGPSVLGFLACGAIVRRDAFLACGGFDDIVFFFGEEERVALDLAAAGRGLAYVADVVAHHHPSGPRDPRGRQVLAERNGLLTALLRRPWPVVAQATVGAVRGGPVSRRALGEALLRTPRALLHRRVVPPQVEAARQLLEAVPQEVPVRD